jgi:glyoxylase-like metal-dependent hydrolase (beta-lactamase superfamily II)
MKLQLLTVGPVSCNCAIVACPETGEAAVIDPGGHPDRIMSAIRSSGVKVRHILHTHGHFDHVLATGEVAAATGAEIWLHKGDRGLYQNLTRQVRMFGLAADQPPAPTQWFADGATIAIGTLSAKVLHTPGHTPGSVGFYFASEALLFSGDTLFYESVGRTDFEGGSADDLARSIRGKLYCLPEQTRVIPGHGDETTIAHERANNPFVADAPEHEPPR